MYTIGITSGERMTLKEFRKELYDILADENNLHLIQDYLEWTDESIQLNINFCIEYYTGCATMKQLGDRLNISPSAAKNRIRYGERHIGYALQATERANLIQLFLHDECKVKDVEDYIDRFPYLAKCWKVLKMRYLDNLTASQVAEQLEVSRKEAIKMWEDGKHMLFYRYIKPFRSIDLKLESYFMICKESNEVSNYAVSRAMNVLGDSEINDCDKFLKYNRNQLSKLRNCGEGVILDLLVYVQNVILANRQAKTEPFISTDIYGGLDMARTFTKHPKSTSSVNASRDLSGMQLMIEANNIVVENGVAIIDCSNQKAFWFNLKSSGGTVDRGYIKVDKEDVKIQHMK